MNGLKIENLQIGMKIQIGGLHAENEAYNRIVGCEGIITHLRSHPNDFANRNDPNYVWVYVPEHGGSGGYKDLNHPTLRHLGKIEPAYDHVQPLLRSWHIRIEDVILIDNEGYLQSLREW